MPRYSFYQDTKVETWERSHFDVTANSYEEAVAIVKAFKDSDVDNHQDEEYIEFGIFESIYETSQKIEPLPGASPTIMIFNEDTGMPVVDNRKPAENNCPNDKEHAIPRKLRFRNRYTESAKQHTHRYQKHLSAIRTLPNRVDFCDRRSTSGLVGQPQVHS